jgi:hypothetical protein
LRLAKELELALILRQRLINGPRLPDFGVRRDPTSVSMRKINKLDVSI